MSTYDIPGASIYGQAVALAKKRYQTRLADINKQRQNILRESGFLADIDPESGLTTNLRTDPYNQYGGFQMLNRTQAMRHDEALGENISRGLGSRGGLGAQNLSNLRFDFGREDAEFGSNLADALWGLTRQQQDEKYAYDRALYEAQLAAAQSAIEAGDYGSYGGDYGYDYADYGEQYEPELKIRPGIRYVGAPKKVVKKPAVKKPAPKPKITGFPGMGDYKPKPAVRPKAAPKPAPKKRKR